jgi:phosphoribosyl-AMP cyclohydrolase
LLVRGEANYFACGGQARSMFYSAHNQARRQAMSGAEQVLAALSFDGKGLVAAVAQQHDSGEVLMLAWMNREAVEETLATGRVCYWSRSRQSLWRKGETSGHVQRLVEFRVDCDGDAVLLLVDQTGAACHTGQRSCFFRAARGGALVNIMAPLAPGG